MNARSHLATCKSLLSDREPAFIAGFEVLEQLQSDVTGALLEMSNVTGNWAFKTKVLKKLIPEFNEHFTSQLAKAGEKLHAYFDSASFKASNDDRAPKAFNIMAGKYLAAISYIGSRLLETAFRRSSTRSG